VWGNRLTVKGNIHTTFWLYGKEENNKTSKEIRLADKEFLRLERSQNVIYCSFIDLLLMKLL
jgi:hypothetical protein